MDNTYFLDQSENQKRQFIDAETVFLATASARKAAAEVRGCMFWRDLRGKPTLIRASAKGAQVSLGVRNRDTEIIYERFIARKQTGEARLKALKAQLATQQRLNRALRVGRVPNVVVGVLNQLENFGIDEHFLVVGTHALFAYETAAGVRINAEALATRDVDMLFDTRKRIDFFTTMQKLDSSLISVLKKADASFEVVDDQRYTSRNQDGFEVDIIRRIANDQDPHPLAMSAAESDISAVQVSMGEKLQSARRMDQVVVGTSGEMALMRTIHPLDFARIKENLSQQITRDPNKATKDSLQAQVVKALVEQHLPNMQVVD